MRRYPAITGAEIVLLCLALFAGVRCSAKQTGAVDAVPKQTTQHTPDPQKLFDQAREAQQSGNAELAVREYQDLISRYPDMVAAHANLAVALSTLGRYEEAIQQYQAALDKAPGDPALRLDLGLAYYKKNDFASAAAQFAPLHKAHPDDVRLSVLLGTCDVQLGRADRAIALLEPLEKGNTQNPDLEWALGNALIRAGREQEGVERVQKVADATHNVEAYQLAADINLGLTFFNKARQDAEAVVRLNPRMTKAYIVLGLVDDYGGDASDAIQEYHKALEIDPQNLQARLQLANALYTERKLDAAHQQVEQLLAAAPNSSAGRYELARIEYAQGNLSAALKDFQMVERQDPQWLLPHVDLTALYYRMDRPEDGARERKIVDQLRSEEQERRDRSRIVSPQVQPR